MAIRHIVLIRFDESATDQQIGAFSAGLDSLPAKISQIRRYEHGPDLGIRQATWDYGLVAEFETPEDFTAYLDHPDHKALVSEQLEPISASRVSVQLQIDHDQL